MALHLLRHAAEGSILRERLDELLARLADRRRMAGRPLDDRGQARLGALPLLLERLRRARQRVVAAGGAIDDGFDQVALQLVGRDAGAEGPRPRVQPPQAALAGACLLFPVEGPE